MLTTPSTYLSTSGGKWRVIHQGMPLCPDRDTRDDALKCLAAYNPRPTLADHYWDGDQGGWLPVTPIPLTNEWKQFAAPLKVR